MPTAPAFRPDTRSTRSNHVALRNYEEPRATAAVVDAEPAAMRGLIVGLGAVLPFWAIAAAIIWRLAGIH